MSGVCEDVTCLRQSAGGSRQAGDEVDMQNKRYENMQYNHNHPSNGWFALGLKAQYYRPAAQAAGFRILKPIAFATFAALERAFVLLATLKRVFVFFYTQFIKCYIMFFLFFYVFPYRSFI